jgi:hypothetical protein
MSAGEVWTWTIGDEGESAGFFNHGDRVFIDAHQIREPFATGFGNEIEWSGLTSEFAVNGKYKYRIRISFRTVGLNPILYHVRVSW